MKQYLQALNAALEGINLPKQPDNLYEPLRYFLAIGGKRTRPSLLLMAHSLFKEDWIKSMPQALAIELFHNFTLIHDDIMDKAELRRSQPTVHKKWNENIAILSGDVLFVKAYDYLFDCDDQVLKPILHVFNETARLVCEGQQMDMDFEQRTDVSISEYMEMIRLKTAVLLGCSLKIGALNAGASKEDSNLMYAFGMELGLGFQLQDDYLDAFGNPDTFGKKVGGDILNNKMTFLSIKLKKAIGDIEFEKLCSISNEEKKVEHVKRALIEEKIDLITLQEVEVQHNKALAFLDKISGNNDKSELLMLASKLMVRNQ